MAYSATTKAIGNKTGILESMVMQELFGGIYKNRTVVVTGHTGFKGSWLVYWLMQMRANVIGYSLGAPSNPNHFDLLNLDIVSIIGDIRDQVKLDKVFNEYKPEIVFHLAAQPLVRLSYENPVVFYPKSQDKTQNFLMNLAFFNLFTSVNFVNTFTLVSN